MKQLVENIQGGAHQLGPHSAVLAIHWQNDVVAPAGALDPTFAEAVRAKGVIPKAGRLFELARQSGAKVIFINVVFEKNYNGLVGNNALWKLVAKSGGFVRGSKGVEVVDELAPKDTDIVLEHGRISAFYGTELLTLLVGHGIRDVYLTGVATNVAVDHTAKDAVQLGFNTMIVDDCCASSNEKYHDAAILTLRVLCTDVVNASEISGAKQASRKQQGRSVCR
jgi:nicotinamidase-related amidase